MAVTIQEYVAERQIAFLLHFTRLENLESILSNGLHTRAGCEASGIKPTTNDAYRLDNTDAVCLSVSFPNYKMFYRLRKEHSEAQWAVVAVNPSVLWLKDCAFCIENAAKATVTDIPVANRKGLLAFQKLFDDFESKQRATNLPQRCPTHPQAEVLVFEHIEPALIVGAAFNKTDLKEQFLAKYSTHQFKYIPALFSARIDHRHWASNG